MHREYHFPVISFPHWHLSSNLGLSKCESTFPIYISVGMSVCPSCFILILTENIYSGVVSLRNLMLVIFLGKLNNLELWGADIGNAYLEAFTDEKLYIVAGPEFQELEGYILIFLKALYGLKSSGKRWAEVIHGILRDMKFLPSKADPCIWLRKAPNLRCYEYIAVYVDDLCIAAESPSAIIQIFKSKYHLKVKGDGKLTYHLGADYFEDPDGT